MTTTVKVIPRTSSGLRDAIFDEWDALRRGESNPQRAIAISKLACQVINSVKMEIEFHSHVQSISEDGSQVIPMSKPLKLT